MKSDLALANFIARDGSRLFFEMPTEGSYSVREHVGSLSGAQETMFLSDVTEMWLDFDYAEHHFSVHDSFGDFRFFVAEPQCPEHILLSVADHFLCH